jgi:AraC-like DNA-binding protein
MQYADADQAPCMVTISFWARGILWETLRNRRFAPDQAITTLVRQILREQEQGNADGIFSLLTLLLLHLQKSGAQENNAALPAVSGENTIIRKAQQYVQEHVAEKLSVPAVAEAIGVSASYLTALFHKHLEFSPAEYIRRIKLGRSKQLIREGQMNFTEISEHLQYSTVHHFSRQFKQMFDMTPTEYAKSVR